ncbi:regulator of microtubule dynamics protein 3 isoform X2 [Protopterus annectens]|uniref:regulator of microtubule dynamics protein 3 isoform X2 n=1 Tax=Protopterus annectens TaxID=7888 RepID=UPI001CFC0BCD|nr:regulator of microtubule dynamics protein 3 isoform X2 [Protopterus annectens]
MGTRLVDGDHPNTVVALWDMQAELLDRLNALLHSVTELRQEVAEVRGNLRETASQIVGDVRSLIEENQRTARRRKHILYQRERSDSASSSSIYFTAFSGMSSSGKEDIESEGGYTTANPESDYETPANAESDNDQESERENEDEVSTGTVKALGRHSPSLTDDDEPDLLTHDLMDFVEDDLSLLLKKADGLHAGTTEEKKMGYDLLLEKRSLYGEKEEFVWRLARAYSDIHELTESDKEKSSYASNGEVESKTDLQKNDRIADSH